MLIVGNWKAYIEDFAKAKKLVATAKRLSGKTKNTIVLAPPASFLSAFSAKNKTKVAFAAQDVSLTAGGAHTAEVTARTYATAGATYAIIGHSERRAAGDTDAIVAEKLSHAIAQGLTPILCVGEHERDGHGQYLGFVREEITSAVTVLDPKDRAKVIVAYEPIWAIGKTAEFAIDPNDLAEMVLYIRKVLAELLPGKSSRQSQVLYGAAVEPSNARDLAGASGIDGFLLGHTSVDVFAFSQLVKELD